MEQKEAPKVFISYSHQSEEFEQKMLGFANRLREDGIDADIDLYNPAPPEGWQRWMEKEITDSEFVIVVCDKSYYEKFYDDHAKGITWEGSIVYQNLYDQKGMNTKFIPVFWNDGDEKYILTPLKPYTYYNVGTDDGYEGLWRHILKIPKYSKPELGEVNPDKYNPLPRKKQRTMFFVTPIDVNKWNRARWKGMVYYNSTAEIPLLGLLFLNYKTGTEIFSEWRARYNEEADNYLSISYIVPPLPKDCYVNSDPTKSYGKGYFVFISINEQKAIERAFSSGLKEDEMMLSFISRFIWVDEVNGSRNRDKFLEQVRRHGRYLIAPIGLKDQNKPLSEENILLGSEYAIELHSVKVKKGTDLDDTDSCKVVLSKPEGEGYE